MNLGIDLGTTNSALAFIDPQQAAETDSPTIRVLEIPQYVAAGRIEPRRTLPSFLYLGDQEYIGVYAREQGVLVPTKCVHSAKSWLSNPEVDRSAKILPWDAQEAGRVLSPVEVSTRILAYMANAWSKANDAPIGEQNVVLTVPASFDEEARELTVTAAREAGIEKLTLLEEPAAAFYSWIANDLARSQKSLFDGQTVLVCDVGGGTSDFTLIRVAREGDRVDFTRTAVGKHLLLGGDNLDLTLAWLVESKLGKTLSVRQRSGLRRQCASAKERLLSDPDLKSVEITVLGAGTSLVGGTLKTEILREEVLELVLDGFLPECELSDLPKEEEQSPFREIGLPYVSDPAVTRHLAAFLHSAGDAKPDAILFNGGFFIPEVLRQRVADVMEHWYGRRPAIFENRDLDLAVAVGAAYYSYVRSTGSGLLVRGGLPRSYFIGLGGGTEDKLRTLCLVPRGAEEGSTVELDPGNLELVANKPVSFRLYSSRTRTEDKAGDIVEFPRTEEDLHLHAPLHAVLRFGKAGERMVPIKLGARLTEVGTLEIWADSKISDHRWRLQFQLRKTITAETSSRPAAVISDETLTAAEALLPATFVDGTLEPEQLPAKLEQTMGLGRNSWPLSAIRKLADRFLELSEERKRSAAHEARWLNLCGLCLRPGFGFPGDDFRIEQARRIYAAGLQFSNQVQNEIEWWIYWGRVAGGLNKNQQTDLFQRLSPTVSPRSGKRPRVNPSLLREMWRAAASLELLPAQTRTQLGEELIPRLKKGDVSLVNKDTGLWCIARLGARKLFYGPTNQVLPPATAARWVEALIKVPKAEDAIASLARRTGDSTRDLSPQTLDLVRRTFPDLNLDAPPQQDLAAMGKIFGEELPSGLLSLINEPGMNELAVIEKLIRMAGKSPRMVLGIGDDCAIYRPKAGEDLIFTTDQLIEGVHFLPGLKPASVGKRALARSLSDIAAMGGEPRFCLVSLAVSERQSDRWIESFFRGLLKLANKTGTALAGGDMARGDKIHCDVMVCGAVQKGRALRRDGARVGNSLWVSGRLGKPWDRRIEPRLKLGRSLLRHATSCIDISDGLALDLHRLCIASAVAAEIDRVPVAKGSTIERALHGGDDYELLFTLPSNADGPRGTTRIGRIVRGTPGAMQFKGNPLDPAGYDHFSFIRSSESTSRNS